ncbi:MAG: DUF4974 domain-containing protein [Bacteroidota bacterium]|nr:DUF4974 domain-containing protein [Bacteroidota bacterium]
MEENKNIGLKIVDSLLEETKSLVDQQDLQEWLSSSKDNQDAFSKYQTIWSEAAALTESRKFDVKSAWENVDSHFKRKEQISRRIRNLSFVAIGFAASLLLVIGLALYSNLSLIGSKMEVATNYGSRTQTVLPDGSVIHLNAGSAVVYHYDIFKRTRNVTFKGEGFFEVAKNKGPFVVTTSEGLKVCVLGTKFNLKAYPDDKKIETSLLEGKVQIEGPGNEEMKLAPGEIATYDKELGQLSKTTGNVPGTFGWMNNKLYMDNMSLGEVCKTLERWYDVRINFSDEHLKEKIHYTGVLKEESICDVLNALSSLSKIQYSQKNKNIDIKPIR